MSARTVLKSSFWRMPPAGILFGLIVLSLTFLGLIVLFSATRSMYDDPTTLLRKQLIWLVIATIAGVVTYMVDLNKLRPYVPILAGGAVLMLVLVLIPGIGVTVNGAQRWIDLGPMRLQASEVGKLGLLFVMAHYLAMNRRFLDDFI
ncbi:MAG: FtsW/RodA/SpoVE family cell cycle protein, partial [Coraliomargarita sp.]